METLFIGCAVVGGTLVVCQFLMTLLGIGGLGFETHGGDVHLGDLHGGEMHGGETHGEELHGDDHESHTAGHGGKSLAPAEAGASWFVSMLSFRAVSAAVAFFGLTGAATLKGGATEATSLCVAVGSGFVAMYVVHSLMRGLQSLDTDGTIRIERAVGKPGTVLLSIPDHNSGSGKIQLKLQNRLIELEAMTANDPLPSGAKIVVVGIIGPDTVAVERMS